MSRCCFRMTSACAAGSWERCSPATATSRSIPHILLSGATLCPVDPRTRGLGEVSASIHAEQITIFHATPTMFRQLVAGDWVAPESVRLVVLGGEATRRADVIAARRTFGPDCIIVNG